MMNRVKCIGGSTLVGIVALVALASLSSHHLTKRPTIVDFSSAVSTQGEDVQDDIEASADMSDTAYGPYQYPDALATDPVRCASC